MSHRTKGHRQQPTRHQEPSSTQYAGEGYRSTNYTDRFGNPRGESEFQGSREYREEPRYGREPTWQNRQDEERMPQYPYREGQPERGYPQWGNDTEAGNMNRSNVTRFGQRREGRLQSFAGRGPQNYKRSDDRISEDINEELTQDPELDASDVNVEVRSGEVVLKGTVPDRESKRRAEEIAECCSGVKDVMNQLRIKREGSSREESSKEDKRSKVAS